MNIGIPKPKSKVRKRKTKNLGKLKQFKQNRKVEPSDVSKEKYIEKIEEEFIPTLNNFIKDMKLYSIPNENWFYTVGIDLGGTNTRIYFSFYQRYSTKQLLEHIAHWENSSQEKNEMTNAQLQKLIQKNIKKIGRLQYIKFQCNCASSFYKLLNLINELVVIPVFKGKKAFAGVIAAAGPIKKNDHKIVTVTNYLPNDSKIEISKCNESLFPTQNSCIIGDIEAACYGLISIDQKQKRNNLKRAKRALENNTDEIAFEEKPGTKEKNHPENIVKLEEIFDTIDTCGNTEQNNSSSSSITTSPSSSSPNVSTSSSSEISSENNDDEVIDFSTTTTKKKHKKKRITKKVNPFEFNGFKDTVLDAWGKNGNPKKQKKGEIDYCLSFPNPSCPISNQSCSTRIAVKRSTPIDLQNHHYLVVNAGTGFGAALIFATTHRDIFGKVANGKLSVHFEVIPLEIGKMVVSCNVANKQEYDIIGYLNEKLYEYKFQPQYSDIVTGRGLKNVFKFARKRNSKASLQKSNENHYEENKNNNNLINNTHLETAKIEINSENKKTIQYTVPVVSNDSDFFASPPETDSVIPRSLPVSFLRKNKPEKSLFSKEEEELLANSSDPETDVIAKFASSNRDAREALMMYYKYLFTAAQNFCITIPKSNGVFICGDNQVKNLKFFEEHVKEFIFAFKQHPKSWWLDEVSFFYQKKDFNFSVEGIEYFIEQTFN